jgi:hypothetical protein
MSQSQSKFQLSLFYPALFLLLYVFLPSFTLSVFLLLRIGSPALAYWVSVALLAGVVFYCRKEIDLWDYLLFFTLIVLCQVVSYILFDFKVYVMNL